MASPLPHRASNSWYRSVLVSLFLLLVPSLFGQDSQKLRFRKISTEDGLSHQTVHCIHQDREGFMWFGALDGLNRYDGNDIIVFRPEFESADDLAADFKVRAIHEDAEGYLWIGCGGMGLFKFDLRSREFLEHHRFELNNLQGLRHESVFSIAPAADGKLWVGTYWGGLHHFDPDKGTFEHFPLRKQEPTNTNEGVINAIHPCSVHTDVLWLATESHGLVKFKVTTGEVEPVKAFRSPNMQSAPNRVSSIAEASPGMLWVTSPGMQRRNGLYRFDVRSEEFIDRFFYQVDENSAGFSSILQDREGGVWAAGYDGVATFSPETGTFARHRYEAADPHGLSHNRVSTLYQDQTGLIWVGTNGGGVCRFDPSGDWLQRHEFRPPGREDTNPVKVSAILRDPVDPEVIWFATNDGLGRWDRQGGQVKYYLPDAPPAYGLKTIVALSPRKAGGFWVGPQRGGLFRYDAASDKVIAVEAPKSLSTNRCRALHEDRTGKLWVCVRSGVDRYDPVTGELDSFRHDPELPQSIPSGWVTGIHETSSGDLWFRMHSGGLARFSYASGNFVHYHHDPNDPRSLSDDRVHSIYEDETAGVIWIGTGLGLNKMDPNTGTITARIPTGLSSKRVIGIGRAGNESLWISTRHGLVEMTEPYSETPGFRLINRGTGLGFTDFGSPSLGKEPGHELFAIQTGILELTSSRRNLRQAPRVVVTDVQLLHGSVSPLDLAATPPTPSISKVESITLTHAQNKVLTFKFSALEFLDPANNRYAYRLQGLDDEWQDDEGTRTATYSTLPSGNYVFQVKASNSHGVWNEEGKTLALTVLPPWWATWWFRLSTVLGLLGSGGAYLRARIRRAHARSERLEGEVTKRDVLNRKLQVSEERFQNLLKNSTEQVWCLEFDEPIPVDLPEMDQVDLIFERTYFAEANETIARAYGTTREELIGSRFSSVMPKSMETTVPLFLEVIRSKYKMTDFETNEVARDGSERVMLNNWYRPGCGGLTEFEGRNELKA